MAFAIPRRLRAPRAGARLDLAMLCDRSSFQAEAAVRALAATAYLGDTTAVCRVLGRYKLFVDTADADLSVHLMLDGFWEMWLTQLMIERVEPGMTCVDVGAHVGYFTMLLADLVGHAGRVHAVEPNAALRGLLTRSVAVNGFERIVTVHPDPLLDRDDVPLDLVIPPAYPGGGHIVERADGPLRGRRFDSLPDLLRADVIKIDAEGSEQAIWAGMRGLLDQKRPLILFLEFIAARYADPSTFLAEMRAEGFALALVDHADGLRSVTSADILHFSPDSTLMLMLQR